MPKFNSSSFFICLFALAALFLSACDNGRVAERQPASQPETVKAATPQVAATPAVNDKRPLIVALGDSLTAGYNLPMEQAWTSLLQQRLDEKGMKYRVVNKGVSGDTSRGGLDRLNDALQGDVRILIVALGGNDMLRGLSVADLRANLTRIIDSARERKIQVVLAGMEAPPNLGADFQQEFRDVYRDLAKEKKLTLIPFFLQNVGGVASLNLPDGIHPNAKGQALVMENIWKALERLLI
ncbi:MAG: arylesterase [Blastocatellia bacterium]